MATDKQKTGKKNISELKVLACGFFLEGYPRYDTVWEALTSLGFERLIDMREKMPVVSEKLDAMRAEQERSPFYRLGAAVRSAFRLTSRAVAIVQAARREKIDVIFIFPSNLFLAVCLGFSKWLHGARLYIDLYTSAYSAVKTHSPTGFKIAQAYALEWLAARLADRLICLTPEYAGYYTEVYKIRADKFSPVTDGVQNIWFDLPADTNPEARRPQRVLYWGNYLIQHGLDMILDSAEALKDENIEFIFCGKGRQESWVREEVRRRNLSNVVFKGFVPTTEDLIRVIDRSDIALGHLRALHDTALSGSNKMKQGMARGKAVITVWTAEKEKLYRTKDNPLPPILQIEPTAKALTEAIRYLTMNPEKMKQIGVIARAAVKSLHGAEAVTVAIKKSFEE